MVYQLHTAIMYISCLKIKMEHMWKGLITLWKTIPVVDHKHEDQIELKIFDSLHLKFF